jgi:hypothetical protein
MRSLSAILLSAFALLALACGNPVGKVREAADRAKQQNELKELGLAIHNYYDMNNKTPQSFADLDKANLTMSPDAASAVRSGQVTVVWGFLMNKSRDKVIAYRTTNGNQTIVLMGDGAVQTVPQATFGTMPQAVPGKPGEKEFDEVPPKAGGPR